MVNNIMSRPPCFEFQKAQSLFMAGAHKLTKQLNMRKDILVKRCLHMPRIVTVPLSLEQRAQLILLTKHAAH